MVDEVVHLMLGHQVGAAALAGALVLAMPEIPVVALSKAAPVGARAAV